MTSNVENSVNFINVPECYLSDEPAICQYLLNNEYTAPNNESTAPDNESTAPDSESTAPDRESTAPDNQSTAPDNQSTAHDSCRIGIFKVGWLTPNDCIESKQHEESALLTRDNDVIYILTFNATGPRQNSTEFYQYCCFNDGGQILGCSEPFQFVLDDFELIDESILENTASLFIVKNNDISSITDVDPLSVVTSNDDRITELTTEVTELREQLEQVQLLHSTVKDDEAVKGLTAEVAVLQQRLANADSQRVTLLDEKCKLESQIEKFHDDLSTATTTTQNQLMSITDERDTLKTANVQLQQQLQESSQSLETTLRSSEALTKERDSLQSQNVVLEKELESMDSLAASHSELQLSYNTISEVNKSLDICNKKLEEKNSKLQKLYTTSVEQIKSLQLDLKTSEEMINELCVQGDFSNRCTNRTTGKQSSVQCLKQCSMLDSDEQEDEVLTYYPIETMFANPYIDYVPEYLRKN